MIENETTLKMDSNHDNDNANYIRFANEILFMDNLQPFQFELIFTADEIHAKIDLVILLLL